VNAAPTKFPFPRTRNWGFVQLWCFGMLQLLSLGRAFLIGLLGDFINELAAAANGVSLVFLGGAVVYYLRKFGTGLRFEARAWLVLVALITAVGAVRGLSAGLIPKFIVLDLLAFIALLLFVVIGSIPRAFEDLQRVWFQVLLISIPLNLFAMRDLAGFSVEISEGVRVARETVSYSTSNTLDVVLLTAGFAFNLARWQRCVVVIGFCQVIAMQILYQKRLETSFYTITAMCLMGSWWLEQGWMRARLRTYLREALAVVAILACVMLALFGRYLVPQATALIGRTKGESSDVEIRRGYTNYFLADNERFEIVVDSLETLSPAELLFGRGLGGGAEWVGFNQRLLNSTRSDEVWGAYFMPDYGFFGRRSFEVGWATPVLKGGLLMLAIIYSIYLMFFFRSAELFGSLTGRVCLVIVLAQNVYAFFGGDFSINVIFQMGNYATCLGMGLSVMVNRAGGPAGPSTGSRPPWQPPRLNGL